MNGDVGSGAGVLRESGLHDAEAVMAAIAGLDDLAARQVDADRLLAAEGAGHIVHDLPLRADGRVVSLTSRPWRLDPVPLVIDGAEFTALADAAIARMRMLEAILVDLYGARELLRDAVVDPVALWGSPKYRLAAFGARPVKRWISNYAVDVIRDARGRWRVVRDVTDAPSGVGYGLLGRAVTARVHRDVVARLPAGHALRSLDPFADRLRDSLADVATSSNPRIVMLSGGVDHRSFVEQSYLATRLGLNIAEGADLVVRQRRVWLRSLAGLEPVDVLFRRLEDDRVDPMEVNAEGTVGVPGLLLAARSGGVSLANAHGTGVLEEPRLAEAWDTVGTWLADRRRATVAPLRTLSASERETGEWTTYPGFDGASNVWRAVTLRLHLVASDAGIDVLQGGSARVLGAGDDPAQPTVATAKDVWVVGGTVAPPALRRRDPLPQVDLFSSVPTRAAEALFWAGRAMERAELVARAMYVVLERTSASFETGAAEAWVPPALSMLATVAGLDGSVPAGDQEADGERDRAAATFAACVDALALQLGSFLAEASSVREYFSVTAGRAFARLAESRAWLRSVVPTESSPSTFEITRVDGEDLELVLTDLASIVGLWNESVVRGPAWRFGEIGRRIERAFGLIDVLRGAFGIPSEAPEIVETWLTAPRQIGMGLDDHRIDFQRQRVVEMVLATNESLVAYRRRHRSDVEFGAAMQLVVADRQNPRSLAAAVASVGHQAGRLEWQVGIDAASELTAVLASAPLATLQDTATVVDRIWSGCDALARDVVGSRLATPIDPRRMGRS